MQAGIYLRKVSRQLAFKLNGFEERTKFIETNNVFSFALFLFLLSPYKSNLLKDISSRLRMLESSLRNSFMRLVPGVTNFW